MAIGRDTIPLKYIGFNTHYVRIKDKRRRDVLRYILKRYKVIRYMLIKYIVINIDTIRVIFYIWQRNNLLPNFLCGVLWGNVEECGGKYIQ